MRPNFSFVFLFFSLCIFTNAFSINLKLVSANVLDQDFYNNVFYTIKKIKDAAPKDLISRATLLQKKIEPLDADIIFLQEFLFDSYKTDIENHQFIIDKNNYSLEEYKPCYLAIAYKKKHFELDGIKKFEQFTEKGNKGFMLLVLKDKESGKKLGVVNAHLEGGNGVETWGRMTREQQKEWGNKTPQETKTKIYYDFRIKQLKQIETKIKEYENIDDWIICGDFNLNISDVKINNKDGYSYIRDNALKESDGWKDADKNNPKKSTCIGSDGTPQRLDYIFYKGALNKPVYKVEIETFDELLRHESNDSGKKGVNSFSDHSPITATWDDLQTTLTILKAKLLSLVKTLG